MFDIVLTILFFVMAWRIFSGVRREAPIFAEFGQPTSLAFLALLFPLAPLAILASPLLPVAGWLVAAACFVPAFVVSRRRIHAFERAGTDRVQSALSTSKRAFGTSLVGFIYIAAHIGLALIFGMYAAGA